MLLLAPVSRHSASFQWHKHRLLLSILPLLHLVPLMFYTLSSNRCCVFPLKPVSISPLLSHPTSWLFDCCSPPSFCMLVWRQAAGVLWLEDQRASERWSPSELGCVGGGEKVYTSIFRVCLLWNRKASAYPAPRPQSHQSNISACALSI